MPNEFLQEVYELEKVNDVHVALDLVFNKIDALFTEGKFKEVDDILDAIDLSRLSTSLMRGFLTITWAGKKHLNNRVKFLASVRKAMIKIRGEEITDKILKEMD